MALTLRNVSHFYLERQVLDHISLHIGTGRFCCITGPSGCGKSTLLRLVAGLEKSTGGAILLDGAPVSARSGQIGMVFQEGALFPWLTARKNVSFGLEMQGFKPKVLADLTEEYLSLVGLKQFAEYYPNQLSGGMRQRLAMARSLAYNPSLVLMDEPFASLDAQSRNLMQAELTRIWRETKKTVVFVTHSIDEAVFLADQIVVLSSRPGQVKADIPVELPRPRLRTSPAFVRYREQILALIENSEVSYEW